MSQAPESQDTSDIMRTCLNFLPQQTTERIISRHAHSVTLYHNAFTCEADTLGSCGYVYIVIYPTQR